MTLLEGTQVTELHSHPAGTAMQQGQTTTVAYRARNQQTNAQALPRIGLYLLSSCTAGATILGQPELSSRKVRCSKRKLPARTQKLTWRQSGSGMND